MKIVLFAFVLSMCVCLASFRSLALTFDVDVPENIKNQMLDDLMFVNGIQGVQASPLHLQIFGHVQGPDYQKYFESRVLGVGLDDCGSSIAVACVQPMVDPNKMWITNNYIKFSHPQI